MNTYTYFASYFRISMLAQFLPVFCSFLWLHLRMLRTTFYYRTLLLQLLQLQLQLLQYIIILGQTVGHLHGKSFALRFWFRSDTKTETLIGRYFRLIPKIPKPPKFRFSNILTLEVLGIFSIKIRSLNSNSKSDDKEF